MAEIGNDLKSMVQELGLISLKFVPSGTNFGATNCVCKALSKFRQRIRWNYHWKFGGNWETSSDDSELEHNNEIGLGTNLKLPNNNAPRASKNIEDFLKSLERSVLLNLRKTAKYKKPNSENDAVMRLLEKLKTQPDDVLIRTDKTNRHILMKKEDYMDKMMIQIHKNCELVTHDEVQGAISELDNFIFQSEDMLSRKEYKYAKESIKRKQIPEYFGYVKDHKVSKDIRLLLPAKNFCANLNKVLIHGLEKIFMENDVKFDFLIKNSYSLSDDLKTMEIHRKTHKIALLDVVSMYPSIQTKLIKEAVEYYQHKYSFNKESRENVKFILKGFDKTLKMNFGLFEQNFWRFRGQGESGLMMGAWESPYLADLTINYVYARAERRGLFREVTYRKTYRDDGFLIFNLKKMGRKTIEGWKTKFDAFVNKLSAGALKFTMETKEITFLDLKIKFGDDGRLRTSIYRKPGEELKYLNTSSMHPRKVMDKIPAGVIRRLFKLTSDLDEKFRPIIEFPDHTEALH